jgi:GNAT superfamily N-acetyltransferase
MTDPLPKIELESYRGPIHISPAPPKPPKLTIRLVGSPIRVHPNDIEVIDRLSAVCFGWRIGHQSHAYHWLAYDRLADGCMEPVAFASMQVINESRAFFASVGVLPEYRGRGLQRRFVRLAERLASGIGMTEVVATVVYNNWPSMNNFIRCGYVTYVPEMLWGVSKTVYFRKWLR